MERAAFNEDEPVLLLDRTLRTLPTIKKYIGSGSSQDYRIRVEQYDYVHPCRQVLLAEELL